MPKRVVVQTLCDPCWAEGIERPGEHEHEVEASGVKGRRVLLLCGPHEDEVWRPLAAALSHAATVEPRGRGRPPTPPADGDGFVKCPVCPGRYATRARVADHARRVHRDWWDSAESSVLRVRPQFTDGYRCPAPECAGRGFLSPQGLIAHGRSVHHAANGAALAAMFDEEVMRTQVDAGG